MRYLLVCLAMAMAASAGTIAPLLVDQMRTAQTGQLIDIYVKPVGDADVEYIASATVGMDRADRRVFACDVMKGVAAVTQTPILEMLKTYPSDIVTNVDNNWLANFISCSATADVIREIAARDDVAWVDFRPATSPFIEPIDERPLTPGEANMANAWGVDMIGAPSVWALGYNGTGIVVAVVDTGVNYLHVDLATHMWHDTPAGLHYGWDMESGDGDPMPTSSNHGTHCAGSVASNGTAGTTCGVAPSATIMAVKVMTSVSPTAEQNVIDGFEWAVDHGADVISTSLGYIPAWNPQRALWRTAEINILAAGIPHSIAAGNEGPSALTIRTPGDCPPPWDNPQQGAPGGASACICVGATTQADGIASFSSIGPVTWETIPPWYDYNDTPPNAGLIRPDVCAPGENITSCNWPGSGYTVMSGTSMATPHNAGLMALMLDANPSLSPAQVDQILEQTALDKGAAGKDNTYGAGRIQALPAVQAAISVGIEGSAGTVPAPGMLISTVSPNPVSSVGVFDLYTGEAGRVTIVAYDIAGREVALVHSGDLGSGSHTLSFTVPASLGNGVYYLRATCNGLTAVRTMAVVR